MINVNTYLRKYSDSSSGIIWVSFYVQRQKVNFSTKVAVEAKNWSERKCQITAGDKQAGDKNLTKESGDLKVEINYYITK